MRLVKDSDVYLGDTVVAGSGILVDQTAEGLNRLSVEPGASGVFVESTAQPTEFAATLLSFGADFTVTESPSGTAVITYAGSGAVAIDDLTDVVITTPATNNYLRYNGSNWVNTAPSGGGTAVGTSRSVNTSTGLTGGGNLSADRTLAIDTAVVPRKAQNEIITGTWTFEQNVTISETIASSTLPLLELYNDAGTHRAVLQLSSDTGGAVKRTASIRYSGDADSFEFNTDAFAVAFTASAASLTLGSGADFVISATKRIYLDGGGDTYFAENGANSIQFTVGGNTVLGLSNTGIHPTVSNLRTLGTSSLRWSTVYGVAGNFSGTVDIQTLTLTNPLSQANGGTGLSSYSTGDILFVNGAGNLQALAIGGTGEYLVVSGGAPSWEPIGSHNHDAEDINPGVFTGTFTFENGVASAAALEIRVASPAVPHFVIRADGDLEWSGGSVAADVILQRSAAGILNLSAGSLQVGGVTVSLSGHPHQILTAGNGITGTSYNGTAARTWSIVSHGGTAGSVGTIVVGADTVGVSLGTSSTTAAAGDHNHTLDNLNGTLSILKGGTGQTGFGGALGQLLYINGAGQFAAFPNGDDNDVLQMDGGGFVWGPITISGVTAEDVASGTFPGAYDFVGGVATASVLGLRVTGDSFPRLIIFADGDLGWGGGTSGTPDVVLQRSSPGQINVSTGSLLVAGLTVLTTGSNIPASKISAGTFGSGLFSFQGNLQFTNNAVISRNTVDGSDSGEVILAGGGGSGSSRGGYVGVYGNEHATQPGWVDLVAGNVSGWAVRFYGGNAERGRFNANGFRTIGANVILDGSPVHIGDSIAAALGTGFTHVLFGRSSILSSTNTGATGTNASFMSNAYWNGTNYIAFNTGGMGLVDANGGGSASGKIDFWTAPSVAAGAALTITQGMSIKHTVVEVYRAMTTTSSLSVHSGAVVINSGATYTLDVTGDIRSTVGVFDTSSDRRLKKNIEYWDYNPKALRALRDLRTGLWNEKQGRHEGRRWYGWVAQEVVEAGGEMFVAQHDNEPWTIQLAMIIPQLAAGWNDHEDRIQILETENKELKLRLALLEN